MHEKWTLKVVFFFLRNGEFTSFVDPNFGVEKADSTQVVVTASNRGSVRFVNSAFWGPSNHIARIDGSGTVGFSDCIFRFLKTKSCDICVCVTFSPNILFF